MLGFIRKVNTQYYSSKRFLVDILDVECQIELYNYIFYCLDFTFKINKWNQSGELWQNIFARLSSVWTVDTRYFMITILPCIVLNQWSDPEWHSGLRHCISVQEATLQFLVWIQAESHPAVFGSPIGRCTIGSASSGIVWGRPSF
jgi:hypothetical protein